MKITTLFLSATASVLAFTAAAQVENDDLYFNSKDRAKLKKQAAQPYSAAITSPATAEQEFVNPTDSYSARNVNPEFTARANAQAAQSDNQDYFVNNYKQTTANNLNAYNNNLNSWYQNDLYSSNYYGSSINDWNSPFYGFNSPYSSPWYNPYYQNTGWSASFSYFWGSSWNYGWGGNYNYWNQPYCNLGWNWGWGYSGMYGNPYYYGHNNPYYGERVAYGKRGTRGSSSAHYSRNYSVTPSSATRTLTTGRSSTNTSSGRVASRQGTNTYTTSSSSTTSPYYNRTWRRSEQNPNQTRTSTSGNTNSFFNNNSSTTWPGGNNNGTRSSSYSPSRSSGSNSSFSGGSRSGSSTGGGSRSSSSSRGRGN